MAAKELAQSLGAKASSSLPMVVHRPSTVRSAALRSKALSLEKTFSMGLKSGLQGRRKDHLLHAQALESAQYAAEAKHSVLTRSAITPSMSRKDNCWDNAPMESVFHTLKTERVHHRVYATRADARRDLFGYIERLLQSASSAFSLGYRAQIIVERLPRRQIMGQQAPGRARS